MSASGYDPKAVEADILKMWDDGGYFHSDPDPSRVPFVITIPPPNVTGALHLGHALNNTLQDVLVRRKRMQGFNACWLPGTDHAGIATQAVVEKRLREESGWLRDNKNPEHREFLVGKIWEWKQEYNARILNQLKRMGCSCDWRRTRFTLDEGCVQAVYETFFKLFRDGLIYRGKRLVNWDTQLQTAVADDEVYHETVRGSLWHIRYPLAEGSGVGVQGSGEDATPRDYLVVATTRPETMLADTAVAVHPEDERFKHLIGKRVVLPLSGRTIPVIADDVLVKREFGTGCVKVTPAHDPNDYACWQRKQGQPDAIEIRNMLTPDGKVHADNAGEGGKYAGLKLDEARKRVVADLEAVGLLEKVEPYETEVGHSERSKSPIQPYLSEQWFMRMGALADGTMDAVRDGRVQFYPARYAKTFLDWLGEKRDWCISRQLWWGHRIPVWRFTGASTNPMEFYATLLAYRKRGWVADLHFGAPMVLHVCVHPSAPSEVFECLERNGCSQDPDVLDTWFSSALWPHSTFGWPSGAVSENGSLQQLELPRIWRASMLMSDARGIFYHPGGYELSNGPSCYAVAIDQTGKLCSLDPASPDFLFNQAIDRDQPLTWFLYSCTPKAKIEGHSVESLAAQFRFTELQGDERRETWSRLQPTSPLGSSIQNPKSKIQNGAPLADLDYFYPTSVLSTARDIITLWVARMVMTGLYNTGRVPFQHVLIHPTIQDGKGQRMSKSAGNGVDPLDLIELYGTDAMRFTLAGLAGETQDCRIPVKPVQTPDGRTVNSSERFEWGRNFCNKVWQASTGFVLPQLDRSAEGAGRGAQGADIAAPASAPRPAPRAPSLAIEDRWILSRLNATISTVDAALDRYQFNEAVNAIYNFFWSDFCDWYVEFAKPRLSDRHADGTNTRREDASADAARQMLAWVLDQSLRLMHPFIPFVTEAVWAELNKAVPDRTGFGDALESKIQNPKSKIGNGEESSRGWLPHKTAEGRRAPLIAATWPALADSPADAEAEREIEPVREVIRALRDIRTHINAMRSASKQPAIRMLPHAAIRCEAAMADRLNHNSAQIHRLGAVEGLAISPDVPRPADAVSKVLAGGIHVFVQIAGLCDIEVERKRLRKEIEDLSAHVGRIEANLSNEAFVAKAPPAKVEAERARLDEARTKLTAVQQNLAEVGG